MVNLQVVLLSAPASLASTMVIGPHHAAVIHVGDSSETAPAGEECPARRTRERGAFGGGGGLAPQGKLWNSAVEAVSPSIFGVQEPGINPTGGAIPRWGGPLGHRAGERGLYQPPSAGGISLQY
jgi:hypothetical protein